MNGKIVNIHHSHLLKYRGRYSTSWAIVNGEKYHGTSLHYITPELDNGPIISSYKCEIKDDDTAESLFTRVEELAFDMFKDNFNNILDDNIDNFLEPESNYYHYDKDSNKDL